MSENVRKATAEHEAAVKEADDLTKIITGMEGGLRRLNAQRTEANQKIAKTKQALVDAALEDLKT